ncbi:sensor histidine kinase [Thiolapillus sp.]
MGERICKFSLRLTPALLRLFWLLLASALWGCVPQSQSGQGRLDISEAFEYAHAPRNSVDPLKLLSGEQTLAFQPVLPPQNIGAYPQTVWLRTALKLDDIGFDAGVLEFPAVPLARLDIWFALPDGGAAHHQGGEWHPYQERSIKHDGLVFPFPEQRGKTLPLVVSIRADTPINFSAVLWSDAAWLQHSHDTRAWYGALVGGLLALLIYNLFLALTLRDASYLYYVGYILSMVFTVLIYSGLSAEYFWPEGKTRTFVLMAPGIGLFLGIAFVNRFLDIKSRNRLLYYASTLISAYGALIGAALVWHVSLAPKAILAETMHVILLLGGVYYVGMSIVSYLLGVRQARFLALAMSLLLAAMVVHFLYLYGHIRYSPWVFHALEAGILAEAVLMSLALSDRIKILNEEKLALDSKYAHIQRQFAREMINIEEAGKQRYASILHDSVGHGLLVLKQRLDGFAEKQTQAAVVNEIDAMKKQCTEVMHEVRSLSHELHPHLLRNVGLRAALLSILKRAFSSSDIAWFADIARELPDISKDTEMAVYRITQEAISNILKYAQASEVYYSLHVDDRNIRVEIKDDGVGFDRKAVSDGLGLKMMEGHVRLLSGSLALETQVDRGTVIRFILPLNPNHS